MADYDGPAGASTDFGASATTEDSAKGATGLIGFGG